MADKVSTLAITAAILGGMGTGMVINLPVYNTEPNITLNKVIDGDTVAVKIKTLPDKFKNDIRIRIHGVDTPESSKRFAKCQKEIDKGLEAKHYVKKLVANADTLDFELHKYGKYSNRILGDVIIDGNSLKGILINGGYAVPYFGEKKSSWCD